MVSPGWRTVRPDPRGRRPVCRTPPPAAPASDAGRLVCDGHAAARDHQPPDAILAARRHHVPRLWCARGGACRHRSLQRDRLQRRAAYARAGCSRGLGRAVRGCRPARGRRRPRTRRHRRRHRRRARVDRRPLGGSTAVRAVAPRSDRIRVRDCGDPRCGRAGQLSTGPSCRKGRSDGGPEVRMSTLLQDLRYAVRTLRHSPGFTIVIVLTLALGIGANTAIFSVVDAVLLKPLPYPHADRLVSLDTKVPGPGKDIYGRAMSYPDMQQLQALTKDFAGVAAYTYTSYNYAGADQARELAATVVSPNLFDVLGVTPAIGRGFTGAELHDPIAVLSYGMWATAFGSDRNIVGRVINLDGQSFTVVGVMPRGFAFPNENTQLWVPLGEALRSNPRLEFNRHLYAFESVARLAAGVT